MTTIDVSPRLKDDGSHAAIAATHVGQAHIAGTGPENTTCSQCAFWHLWKRVKVDGDVQEVPTEAGRFSDRHKSTPGARKHALCNKPIMNKARRKVPPDAGACRFFIAKTNNNRKPPPNGADTK